MLSVVVIVAIGAAAIYESNGHAKTMLRNTSEKAAAPTVESRCKTIA